MRKAMNTLVSTVTQNERNYLASVSSCVFLNSAAAVLARSDRGCRLPPASTSTRDGACARSVLVTANGCASCIIITCLSLSLYVSLCTLETIRLMLAKTTTKSEVVRAINPRK